VGFLHPAPDVSPTTPFHLPSHTHSTLTPHLSPSPFRLRGHSSKPRRPRGRGSRTPPPPPACPPASAAPRLPRGITACRPALEATAPLDPCQFTLALRTPVEEEEEEWALGELWGAPAAGL
jgi:hypothetical protein